jgi:type IV pilus assembly protein PilB
MNQSDPGSSGEAVAPEPSFVTGFLDALIEKQVLKRKQLDYALRVQAKLEAPRPILVVLCELGYVTMERLKQAYRDSPVKVMLGQFLVEFGYIAQDQLDSALAFQRGNPKHKRLGEILVERNLISEGKLIEALADLFGYLPIDLSLLSVDPKLFSKKTLEAALKYGFFPVERRQQQVVVAFGDPLNKEAQRVAQQVMGMDLIHAVARPSQIQKMLQNYDRSIKTDKSALSDQGAVGLVNQVFEEAIRQQASDIHIEPLENSLRVRFRIDGVMAHYRNLPLELAAPVASRIKVMAGADIAEKRRHQDGRVLFELPSSNQAIDMRVSIYATINGEKIVIRLLSRKAALLDIREIGMAPATLERFTQECLDAPTGIVIVTGPTGSGKTTTLYSAVDYLNDPEVSIITAEDPVEYVIDGIAQCSINPKINLTFQETLRHIVRQDPDIIVLGEIRDKFSAETAIQASLTGHLVLTTLHTEDAIGGLLRLLNMDIEAFLIASTVVAVMAQRLLRKVCRHCGEPYKPDPVLARRLGLAAEDIVGANFLLGKGCEQCRFTGYAGRACVFELLVLNEQVKDAIMEKQSSYQIRRLTLETAGLVSLLEDGLVKAAAGITSLQEVLTNLPRFGKPRPLYELRRLLGSYT